VSHDEGEHGNEVHLPIRPDLGGRPGGQPQRRACASGRRHNGARIEGRCTSLPCSPSYADTDVLRHRVDHSFPRGGDVVPAAAFMSSAATADRRFASSQRHLHGTGIAAMHYSGMAAMREHVELGYDRIFVALSLIIAIGASTAALFLAFRTTDLGQNSLRRRHGPGHFRYALYGDGRDHFCSSRPRPRGARIASLDQTNLALAVAGITFVIWLRIDCLPVRAEARRGSAA